jgi:hypothetical protein
LDLSVLTERTYRCFGAAAENIPFEGRVLDRLTVLGMLSRTQNSAKRRSLFMSLSPVWRSVNGDGKALSPYRHLVRLRNRTWQNGADPFTAKAAEFGIDLRVLEEWLTAALRQWRECTPDRMIEPWDFHYEAGEASRVLSPHIPLRGLRNLNDRHYSLLGADPARLGVHYELEPKKGKDPVAFTVFGARSRQVDGLWSTGEFWVFASYRVGGLDNLSELLHETGHAIHIAAIRSRPAFHDWPDSDAFTEALADLTAFDLYEPEWQERFLGVSATRRSSLLAKYSAIMLDTAWALFELRMQRDPESDPNRVWTDLTREHLRIRPHPELSWWALRGQLIDSPGYMLNYALGAIINAELRARVKDFRGSAAGLPDPGRYPWLVRRLYRFGRERPSREVIETFLATPLSPRALLDEIAQLKDR